MTPVGSRGRIDSPRLFCWSTTFAEQPLRHGVRTVPLTAVFERFTDRARRVLTFAQEEARPLNHAFIGTEHIFSD